jgi:CRISPR system Cascade subunit CasE
MSELGNRDILHMVQLYLDPCRLVQLGKMQGLPLARTDTNYLVHCALGELFGDSAPKPFYVDDDPRTVQETIQHHTDRYVRVVGYTNASKQTLANQAKIGANPTLYEMVDWDQFAVKDMPDAFPEGLRLQFELRACPVVRKASAGTGYNQNGDERTWNAGEELDAFLAEAWTRPEDEDLSREQIYRDWLQRQFDIRDGAEPESIAMERFSIERMTRRTQGRDRTAKTIKRPDVTLAGTLRVTDSDAFVDLLRSGIGRHKTFGFGMLKIRRA